MAETEYQSVTLDDGTVVHARINRRGCDGEWTEESRRHMAALIRAVHEQFAARACVTPAQGEQPDSRVTPLGGRER